MAKRIPFPNHFHETFPAPLDKVSSGKNLQQHKKNLYKAFEKTKLLGITEDDCTIFPRVLPGAYIPTIENTAKTITLFALRLLSLPEKEIKAILPSGPIRDHLINDLEVLKYRKARITGSFRFDMAIVGPPKPNNPPKLLELNEIGFDGLARSSLIQKTMMDLVPKLKEKFFCFDTAAAEARNMRRIAKSLARIQFSSYNWEEEVLVQKAKEEGVDIRLICPTQFNIDIEANRPLLSIAPLKMVQGRAQFGKNFQPEAIQFGYSFKLSEYEEVPRFYRALVQSKTPQYGSILTGLVSSKMILVLLSDPHLRRRLLGSANSLEDAILPATPLQGHFNETKEHYQDFVLKHVDGLGGEQVYFENELLKQLKKIEAKEQGHWVVQERTQLNTIDVYGILSRPRKVIGDLGVFVQYDWAQGKFLNFGVGGFITRATNRSFKVNVSGGGIQVPVMFSK